MTEVNWNAIPASNGRVMMSTKINAPETVTLMQETYTVSVDSDGDVRLVEDGGTPIDMSPAAARAIAKAILAMTSDAQAPAPVAAPAPIAAAKPAPPPTERAATRRWPWGVMKVGDHFFAPGNRPTINNTRAKVGKRFTTQAKTVNGVHGFLVWRMS
jgi:hypothetical protein